MLDDILVSDCLNNDSQRSVLHNVLVSLEFLYGVMCRRKDE